MNVQERIARYKSWLPEEYRSLYNPAPRLVARVQHLFDEFHHVTALPDPAITPDINGGLTCIWFFENGNAATMYFENTPTGYGLFYHSRTTDDAPPLFRTVEKDWTNRTSFFAATWTLEEINALEASYAN